jgi:hypothetical protein
MHSAWGGQSKNQAIYLPLRRLPRDFALLDFDFLVVSFVLATD